MKARYYPRVVVQASAVFTVDGLTCEGQVFDLTVPGCLIDSPLTPKKGDSLTLCVSLSQGGTTFRVARAVVRWAEGSRFGVEFIEMDDLEQFRYNATVSTLLSQQVASLAV